MPVAISSKDAGVLQMQLAAQGLTHAIKVESELARPVDIAASPVDQVDPDLHKPLVWQVLTLGMNKKRYIKWVHQPKRPASGAPKTPRLFDSELLESCTHTRWWVVPTVWLPVAAGCWANYVHKGGTVAEAALLATAGGVAWTGVEYALHRFVFHGEGWLPDHPLALTVHFLLHGIHHKFPNDPTRLVMPPVLSASLAAALWAGLRTLLAAVPAPQFAAFFGAGLLGYVGYDMTHYALHHQHFHAGSYLAGRQIAHLRHHGERNHMRGFGVTTDAFDRLCGTRLTTQAAALT